VDIYNNAPGCNNEDEVIAACESFGFQLDLRVFLEGSFNGTNMDVDLCSDEIPLYQPYNNSPWDYPGGENLTSVPEGVVDWLLIELRDAPSAAEATGATVISRQAALVMDDGSVVGLNGTGDLLFYSSISNNLYVVIWHRNHLGIMSATALTESGGVYSCDFTINATQAYNSGQKDLGGVFGMIAADANADGEVNPADRNIWSNQAGESGYNSADMDMNTQVDNQDKNNEWQVNLGEESQIPE
jgi:hypothetical protein